MNNKETENQGSNIKFRASRFNASKDYTAKIDPIAEFDVCARACGDFIACLNELADSWMNDALGLLRQEKWYKQEVKQNGNLAQASMRECIKGATARIKAKYKQWYFEYVDAYQCHMKRDVDMLYWTISQALKKAEYGRYAEPFAKMETARILVQMSVQAFSELFKDSYNRCHYDWSNVFSYCKPQGAFKYWDRMEQCISKQVKVGKDVELGDEEAVVTAYNIIRRKMVNGEYLDESAMDALDEMREEMNENERKEFEQIKANAERNKQNG